MEMPSSDRRCAALISGGGGRHPPRWELLSRAAGQRCRPPRASGTPPSVAVSKHSGSGGEDLLALLTQLALRSDVSVERHRMPSSPAQFGHRRGARRVMVDSRTAPAGHGPAAANRGSGAPTFGGTGRSPARPRAAPVPRRRLPRPWPAYRGSRTVRPQSPSRLCATDSTPGCGVPEVPDRRLRGRLAGRGEPRAGRPRRVLSSPRPAGRCGGRGGLEGSLGARPGSSICSARRTSGEARVIESELNAITPKG